MKRPRLKPCCDLLETRSLLTLAVPGSLTTVHLESKTGRQSQALVGSIQGTEIGPVNYDGLRLSGTGVVQPLGNVAADGYLMYNPKTGAVNSHGALTLSSSLGSVTLSMKSTKGYVPLLKIRSEEIPVSVQVQAATGSFKGLCVKGTLNLVNVITLHRVGGPSVAPLSIQFNLKPPK